jgi:type III secretion system chaperone SycN
MLETIATSNIAEFINRTFGLTNIEIHPDKTLALTLANDYTLVIDFLNDNSRLSILKQVGDYDTQTSLFKLLELCHFDNHHSFSIQAGYLEDNILSVSAHIKSEQLTLPNLNKYFETLLMTLDTAILEGIAP